MRAIVLAGGGRPTRAALDRAWPGWDADVELVVAADGGARLAPALGLRLDAWVGDADSLDAVGRDALTTAGIVPAPVAPDKDASDTELALEEAVRRGATDISVLGALGGGRVDHALANVTLLGHPGLGGVSTRLLDPGARITLVSARGDADTPGGDPPGDPGAAATLAGRVGDLVTLLPVGADVPGVVTEGLHYPLGGERLEAGRTRGLSNVRSAPEARVSVASGRLLIIETPATLAP